VNRRVIRGLRRGLALIVAARPEADEGDVLVERAAGGDVQHLDAPADAEHREVAFERPAGQGDLESVTRRIDLDPAPFPKPLAVERGIDILAPGQHESIEIVEGGLRRIVRAGEERHRLPAGRLDRVQVVFQLGGTAPGDADPRPPPRHRLALPTPQHDITLLDFPDQVKKPTPVDEVAIRFVCI
jgi:hypothetical protein